MMKKYTFFFFLFSFIAGFSQTTNTLIRDASGELLPDEVTYCPGESFNLKVDADAASTDSYTATKETLLISAGSTDVTFDSTGPNIFSRPVEIGFDFSFYGKTYQKVVVGRNGRLVFTNDAELNNLHNKSTYKDRTFSGVSGYSDYATLPSSDYNKVYLNDATKELNLAQIFFGYTDLYFNSSYASKTFYKFTKNYLKDGRKGLLISIQQMVRTNGSGGFSSNSYDGFVWLLTTGEVIIRVNNKTDATYNSILGMQDETGTKFFVPTHSSGGDYNNGKWKSEGIAWVFKANLKPVDNIEWLVDHVSKGTGDTFEFTPSGNQLLEVKITYEDGTTEQSSVKFNPKPVPEQPTFTPTPITGCAAGYTLNVDNYNSSYTYTWYKDGDVFASGNSAVANETGTYYVEVNNGCQTVKSAEQSYTINSDLTAIPFENGKTFNQCDKEFQTQKVFTLTDVVGYQPDSGYTIEFIDTGGNVVVASSANGYKYVLQSGSSVTLTLKVSSTTSDCTDSKSFVLSYLSFPSDGTTITAPKLCSGTDSYTLDQFKIDFPQYANYYITFPSSVNPKNGSVKVILSKENFSCQSNLTLAFDFYDEITVKTYTQFPEHCSSSTEYFDLNDTKNQLEYDDVTATFYTSYDGATHTFSNPITNLQYRGSGSVYVKLENSHGCTYQGAPPTLDLIIYRPPTLLKSGPETKYSQCGEETFNLTTNILDYIGQWDHYSEIRYYDQNGTRLSQSDWESYNPDVKGQPYMVFVYNETNNLECLDRIEFNLIKKEKPTVLRDSIMICEETVYPLDQLKSQLVSDPSHYIFLDDNEQELNSNIIIGNLTNGILKIKIKDRNTGCTSDPITITFYTGKATRLIVDQTTVEICDDDFDGLKTVNLEDYLQDLTSGTSASVLYFSDENLSTSISDPASFSVSDGKTVYLKIQSSGYCPSVGKITFKVNTPTKSSTLEETYYICYGDQLIVEAGKENVSFQWSGGTEGASSHERIFTEAGRYSVTLTNADGCSYTHNFVISDEHQPVITQINQDNDKIEVLAEGGSGHYEYSFDGGWQPSNIYLNPTMDNTYTIQVRSVLPDGSTCNGAPKSIFTITIHNVITPNGDGKNDTWKIRNLRKMSQISVLISDRYGRTVYSEENNSENTNAGNIPSSGNSDDFVWDGKVNGRPLSTGTYWYVVKWYDPTSLKNEIRTGWILLKNRE